MNTWKTEGDAPLLLTTDEAARALGLSPRKVWELGAVGELPRVQIGRSVRFARGDIEDFIARQRRKAVQR
jgi:excisionase family DNA binding protein